MANRRSLALRRNDASVPLRPAVGSPNAYDAALRSDFSYIPEDLDPPKAILHVRDLTHTSAEVAFDPLQMPTDPNFGAPTEIALVRSPSGFPVTLLDGIMVRRHPPTAPDNDGWVRIPDTGLTPGTWYYYGLFAKYFSEGNTHWLRVGERSVLLPQEYLSADHLWERIPEWYRRQDMEPGNLPGVLRRLIDSVGYMTDAHRTWAYTVGDVWDAEKLSADLLPYLGDTLGQPVEYAAGDERYRSLLSNILPLRKMKGTEHGTEAYLSSLTGYRTRVYPGLNLLPTIDEAEAKYSSGLWTNSGTATLTRQVSTGGAIPGPAAGATYHRLTFDTAAAQQPWMQIGLTDLTKAIPVEAGHQLVTSLFFRSSFTGTLVARYRWFGANGAVIGGDTVATIGAIDGTWVRRNAAAVTVPAGAAFAGLAIHLSVSTSIGGLVIETTEIQVADLAWRPEDAPGSATTPPLSWAGTPTGEYSDVGYYEPPRTVHINVYPQRINYALNSEFSMDNIPVDAWTVAERATWGLLPQAYSSWGDIHDEVVGDSEADWGDLAEGFEALGGDWTITFETANKRLALNPAAKVTTTIDDPGYLVPTVGIASTPDPGPLPARSTIVARIRGPLPTAVERSLVSQDDNGSRAWVIARRSTTGLFVGYFFHDSAGVFGSGGFTAEGATPITGQDESYALAMDWRGPTMWMQTLRPTGDAWVAVDGGNAASLPTWFDSTAPLRIGAHFSNAAANRWDDRIYSVECRSGLDPTGEAVAGATVEFPGVDGNYLSIPDAANLAMVGNQTIIMDFTPDVVTGIALIVARMEGPAPSYQVYINALNIEYSYYDTTPVNVQCNPTVSPNLVAGVRRRLAVTRVMNAGVAEIRWFTSSDLVTWTPLGTMVQRFNVPRAGGPSRLLIGTQIPGSGSSWPYDGRVHRLIVTDGTGAAGVPGGTPVFDYDEALIPNDTVASFPAHTGQTITVNQTTGQKILQPVASQLLWRFDANDYPGTGTSYVDPRGRTWTLTSASAITPKTMVTNHIAQVQSGFVPVVAGDSISAAFTAWATVPGVQLTMSVQFFTDDAPEDSLSIDGVNQDVRGASQTMTTSPYRYELRNAVIPLGATHARVIVETRHTEDYDAYLQQALIENAQVPGPYFNGDEVDSAYGDYFFIGLPHESYSVYYQNYRSFINDAGGDDRITSLMDELLPMETDFVLRTAAYGLY